ncbi:sigma-E factor negative regulatory protein [Paraburkholderia tagetis]|uniref:Sigma-E factor negative regulatory protein n=1 Tax=Paraburkholderia tagetis TaxID=2913261 RepID=A0A9X1RNV8_9BURK|nr:sigma-E factor negative regulatory protein [Paraburkholderia tagetis]MCG5074610.1 sigma-E factor negative regulatory protein [Paraburkholderia tagetis]
MGSVSMQSVSSSRGEQLSAFVDGETAGDEQHLNAIFSGLDQDGRTAWSSYHLIGDVLRSDDLAMSPAASQSFMAGFAARFEAEPHVLAPAALPAAAVSNSQSATHSGRVARILALRRRVVPSLAVAAAAATLTWIVMPQMRGVGTAGAPQIASVQSAGDHVQRVAMNTVPVQSAAVQDGNIIRDARLDEYLEAHQQFAQQPVMTDSMPFIRSAALTTQGQ